MVWLNFSNGFIVVQCTVKISCLKFVLYFVKGLCVDFHFGCRKIFLLISMLFYIVFTTIVLFALIQCTTD